MNCQYLPSMADSRRLPGTAERSGQPLPQALDLLAPQELQIARPAAEGLSNRQIGQ